MTIRLDCLLIRHGSTTGNEEKRYTGCRTNEDLSGKGREECNKLRMRMSGTGLIDELHRFETGFAGEAGVFVISGGLVRCRTSAELIFPGALRVTDELLTEIDFGRFEGKNYNELKNDKDYISWLESGGTNPFPGGESRENFIERSFNAFEQDVIRYAASGKTLAFVCHGGNIMSVMSRLTGRDYFDFQVGCCEGYRLVLTVDSEERGNGIDLVSYDRIFCGNPA